MTYEFKLDSQPSQGLELDQIALTPETDAIALEIATFLANGLNYYFYKNIKQEDGRGTLAVKNVLEYDALLADNSQFPLLKVYRTKDVYAESQSTRSSIMVVTYSFLAPDQEKLPGLLQWFSHSVNYMLNLYHEINPQKPFTIVQGKREGQYRIMMNEINKFAFPIFRMEFELVEIVC